MKKINEKEYLWVEKYRPQCVDDLIISTDFKRKLKEFVKDNQIPNIALFSSFPGIGKSSTWSALIGDLNADYMIINCSKDNGIDILRSQITEFVTRKSAFGSKNKIVILEESDYLTTNAQAAIRRDMEEFSESARFIMTGNYKEKIIDAVFDRVQDYEIDKMFTAEKSDISKQMILRLKYICENENVKYDIKDLATLVKQFYPSIRSMIQELQKNIIDNEFKLLFTKTESYNELIDLIKNKKFNRVKEYVDKITIPEMFFTWLWKNLDNLILPQGQVQIIPLMAEYQDMTKRAINKQIPVMAFLIKLMETNLWKGE